MTGLPVARAGVLVLAGGAAWEADAIRGLTAAGHTVVKRCVDVADLMGSASAGHASVALVAGEVTGLDADAVTHLFRHDVRTVAVTDLPGEPERLGRLGVLLTVPPDVPQVVAAVGDALTEELVADPEQAPTTDLPEPGAAGRVVTVWGPAGAPGRTTVALGLAAVLAAAGRPVTLLDADPYGGAVAQQLGVLDEVSGLLAAARLANTGRLDRASFAACARAVAGELYVLTGLPRGERRVEVRRGVLPRLIEEASGLGDVVVDTGFCVEDDDRAGGGSRDQLTLDALASADEVVVVGSAEPVGLARLARALVDLADVVPGVLPHVVVNRFRPSLGWREQDVTGMVEGYLRPASLRFLPFDPGTLDKAAVAGRTLVEMGDSALGQRLAELADDMLGAQLENSSQSPPVV